MAISRNYPTTVPLTAGAMAIVLNLFGELVKLVNTMSAAVVGGLSIHLFGVSGMQGVTLIQSDQVILFDPKQHVIGALILNCDIGGNLALLDGISPFQGLPPFLFAVKGWENINR